jgi:hypothetical protein
MWILSNVLLKDYKIAVGKERERERHASAARQGHVGD